MAVMSGDPPIRGGRGARLAIVVARRGQEKRRNLAWIEKLRYSKPVCGVDADLPVDLCLESTVPNLSGKVRGERHGVTGERTEDAGLIGSCVD